MLLIMIWNKKKLIAIFRPTRTYFSSFTVINNVMQLPFSSFSLTCKTPARKRWITDRKVSYYFLLWKSFVAKREKMEEFLLFSRYFYLPFLCTVKKHQVRAEMRLAYQILGTLFSGFLFQWRLLRGVFYTVNIKLQIKSAHCSYGTTGKFERT